MLKFRYFPTNWGFPKPSGRREWQPAEFNNAEPVHSDLALLRVVRISNDPKWPLGDYITTETVNPVTISKMARTSNPFIATEHYLQTNEAGHKWSDVRPVRKPGLQSYLPTRVSPGQVKKCLYRNR